MMIMACQLDLAWEDKQTNYNRAAELLQHSPPPPGALVILPEMFATGFSMNVASIQETEGSETEAFLAGLARDLGVFVLGGVVRAGAGGRGRNEAVAFNPRGELITRYCKIHPFSFGGESKHYEPGSKVVLFEWGGFKAAPFVCYDLRFPEVFREAVRQGAQLFVVIANWPAQRVGHWLTLLQARAIENQAYVAGVNRCGADPKLTYPGRSVVIDPKGEVLADAGEKPALLRAAVDVSAVLEWRDQFPALADMRGRSPA